jgi:hypothetical protein
MSGLYDTKKYTTHFQLCLTGSVLPRVEQEADEHRHGNG